MVEERKISADAAREIVNSTENRMIDNAQQVIWMLRGTKDHVLTVLVKDTNNQWWELNGPAGGRDEGL